MSRRRRIDSDPAVKKLAATLGIAQERDLSREIARTAVGRVEVWMAQFDVEPGALRDVHDLVLSQTGLKVEHVRDDTDLTRITNIYRSENRGLPVQLAFEFDRDTEALVFRRPTRHCPFLAVIDARGSRIHRAWFAERHEASHLLVPDPANEQVLRRTHVERPEPLEQVIDEVAAAVGFYEPIVRPVVQSAVARHPFLIDAFEEARRLLAPDASREASYRAFTRTMARPVLLLRVDVKPRKRPSNVHELLDSRALRVHAVVANEATSKHRMNVWPNFRIPKHSVIHHAFSDEEQDLYEEVDDLKTWNSSSGARLGPCRVLVRARGAWASLELAE